MSVTLQKDFYIFKKSNYNLFQDGISLYFQGGAIILKLINGTLCSP